MLSKRGRESQQVKGRGGREREGPRRGKVTDSRNKVNVRAHESCARESQVMGEEREREGKVK